MVKNLRFRDIIICCVLCANLFQLNVSAMTQMVGTSKTSEPEKMIFCSFAEGTEGQYNPIKAN